MTEDEAARPKGDGEKSGQHLAAAYGGSAAGRREISDARTMRALAHPVRVALLEALGREGPLTATRAAELLDESPGNMSWHLQTLAKYGFVEEAGGGRGRSRPWRVIARVNSFDSTGSDPEQAAAGDALEATYQERNFQRLREWWARRQSYPVQWRKAAFSSSSTTYMTAEEVERLSEEINALMMRYRARALDRSRRPEGALPVRVVSFAHPLPVTPSGN